MEIKWNARYQQTEHVVGCSVLQYRYNNNNNVRGSRHVTCFDESPSFEEFRFVSSFQLTIMRANSANVI